MNETINQQDIMDSVPYNQGSDNTVSVDVSSGDLPIVETETTEAPVADVSGGDVTTFPPDASLTMMQELQQTTCACIEKPLLWESDISNYDTTDGLLLLILIFTMLNTALNVFRK